MKETDMKSTGSWRKWSGIKDCLNKNRKEGKLEHNTRLFPLDAPDNPPWLPLTVAFTKAPCLKSFMNAIFGEESGREGRKGEGEGRTDEKQKIKKGGWEGFLSHRHGNTFALYCWSRQLRMFEDLVRPDQNQPAKSGGEEIKVSF